MNVDNEIYDALMGHLEDNQVTSPPLRIAAPLAKFTPQSGETYLRASFLPNQTLNPHVANNSSERYVGLLQVAVVFPVDMKGMLYPLEVAGQVIQQFSRDTQLYTAEGKRIEFIRTAYMSSVISDPSWPFIPVTIPYALST